MRFKRAAPFLKVLSCGVWRQPVLRQHLFWDVELDEKFCWAAAAVFNDKAVAVDPQVLDRAPILVDVFASEAAVGPYFFI